MGRSLAGALTAAMIGLALVGCGGGSNTLDETGTSPPPPQPTPDSGCSGFCATAASFLTPDDVRQIIAQAVNEAKAINRPGTIVVTDRLGNVLAVYRMAGASPTQRVSSERGLLGGLENLNIPAEFGAISKALTSVYFSSEGNAFTSRTAGQIVQEHFNPGDVTAPSGPLFGVQISNLPCSDINVPFNGVGPSPGPHPAPVGLAADPGGISLYKLGVPVGAIGVAADEIYGLDANALDRDPNVDEIIAKAGSFGFAGPIDRRADRITAGGLVLRYANTEFDELARNPASAPGFATLTPADGALIEVPGYALATVQRGTAFGQPESGVRAATAAEYPTELDAFVVVDPNNVNRFPPRAGTEAGGLTADEVKTIAIEGIKVAKRARAQVRRPLGSPAGETVVIVDSNGVVLAIVRTRDALVDAIDVTTQKARTAAFFSNANAANDIVTAAPAAIGYFGAEVNVAGGFVNLTVVATSPRPADYIADFRAFLGLPNALADGQIAQSTRSLGLLERPLYPDGVPNTPPGPLSPPIAQWSIFNTGLELDLIYNQLAGSIAFYLQQAGLEIRINGVPTVLPTPSGSCTGISRIPNGYTLFGGGFPIYKNGQLVGGIGASGDGTDQSDLVAFLGLANAGAILGNGIGNAPTSIRADTLSPRGARLLYVQCPQAPFNNSNDQFVCEGL